MGLSSRAACVFVFTAMALALFVVGEAQSWDSMAPAPAPTSDGTSIDQGVAYVLMVLALALTYIIHAAHLSI